MTAKGQHSGSIIVAGLRLLSPTIFYRFCLLLGEGSEQLYMNSDLALLSKLPNICLSLLNITFAETRGAALLKRNKNRCS